MKKLRINNAIKAETVRVIDEKGNQLGVMHINKAREIAIERGYDLVEVSPLDETHVCKLMDYGNYLYKQKKTEQKHVRLSIRINSHDLEVKAKQARNFLEKRHVIKVSLILKGREHSHKDLAEKKLHEFAGMLEDISQIDQKPKFQGSQITMILIPI